MLEFQTISKQHPAFPEYLDFERLRAIGIDHLQRMSGQVWSDYNLHDPGVTILEVLCYAITDLGYRNNLDIKDLLTQPPGTDPHGDNNFFTPDQILTCNPVTAIDVRKRLLDIEGVRNAWVEPYRGYRMEPWSDGHGWTAKLVLSPPPPATDAPAEEQPPHFEVKGLYTVCLDLDTAQQRDACGQVYDDDSSILDRVYAVLGSYRNLCEDIHDVIVLGEEAIGLRANLDLEATANAEDVLVEAYLRVQTFLAPHVKFYTLQDMLARGKDPTEIFAGRPSALGWHDRNAPRESAHSHHAAPSHGFIDTQELEALTLPKQLHTSDLYAVLLGIPGVRNVTNLSIRSYINGVARSQEEPWWLNLTPNYRPVLGIGQSQLLLYQGGVQVAVDRDRAQRRYAQQKLTHLKAHRSDAELDLSVPQGIHYPELAEHYSIHHDFPLTYGISEDGLPATATAERKAQAKQLQGYLVFFDQILANYLMQLAQVRELFTWNSSRRSSAASAETGSLDPGSIHTYFPQGLNFPGIEHILKAAKTPQGKDTPEWKQVLTDLAEDRDTALDRRNRFLDHMLARFAESFTDYVLINYRQSQREDSLERQNATDRMDAKIIADKARFLDDYPALSRDRFRAINYRLCNHPSAWDNLQVSGFEERIGHLLGMHDVRQRSLVHYQVVDQPSDFVVRLGWGGNDRDRPLICRQTYPTLAAAQEGLDTLLEAILQPARFQPLVYTNPYHSLEVVDTDGSSLVLYDHAYPTEGARNRAIEPLVQRINRATVQQVLTQLDQQRRAREFDLTSLAAPLQSDLKRLRRILLPDQEDQPLEDSLEQLLGLVLRMSETEQWAIWVATQRDAPWQEWLNLLQELAQSSWPTGMLEHSLTDGEWGFILKLDPVHQPQLRFVSAQRYAEEEKASRAAERALVQMQDKRFYHPISLRSQDVETGVTVDGKLTTYGFAIADASGQVLASLDDTLGSKTAAERDATMLALHSSQSTLQFDRVQDDGTDEIVSKYKYRFDVIVDSDNTQQVLPISSVSTFANQPEAWAAVQILTESLHCYGCYSINDLGSDSYQLAITDRSGADLARSASISLAGNDVENLRFKAFRWINSLSPFIVSTQDLLPDSIGGQDNEYRFQIYDRSGNICLEGVQWFETDEEARDRCYRDVIGTLWDDRAIARTQVNGRYSFAIEPHDVEQGARSETSSYLAFHPHTYASEAERERAIQRLKTLVRTAHLNARIQQTVPGCRGQVNIDKTIQLQTTQHFAYSLAHLEVRPRPDSATDNTAGVDPSTLSNRAFSPFDHGWDGSHWNEILDSLGRFQTQDSDAQTHGHLALTVEFFQQSPLNPGGFRFFLTPEPSEAANLRWRFSSTRAYASQRDAEVEGNRARQLLPLQAAKLRQAAIQQQHDLQLADVIELQRRLEPPFPTPSLWLLQQERLRTVNYALVLLDAETVKKAKRSASSYGDTLVRMAEIDDTYRRIDPHPSALEAPREHSETERRTAAYGWSLLGSEDHRAIAVHPPCYATATDRNTSIQRVQTYVDDEGLHALEHILLRSPSSDPSPEPESPGNPFPTLPIHFPADYGLKVPDDSLRHPLDPYSFWLTVVLPAWPLRFQDRAFRQFVERTLRLEAPAHIALKVAWLDLYQMSAFEAAYRQWLEQKAVVACGSGDCGYRKALAQLVHVLSRLRGVYPPAHLADSHSPEFTQDPVVLNQTPLGSNYE
ncbi:hypothetical protein C8255_06745 [filamentous cyanobacterium CCP3]|nr:hypothetical protein C8255_06745 [filamentous cyanobacterium CCP3]